MSPKGSLPDIKWKDTSKSTNSEALRNISHLDNMSVIAAFHQTGGRGTGLHEWHSEAKKNITASLVLKPGGLLASDAALISAAAALGIHDYLSFKGINAGIKLPNDIWVGSRKICGLLIENQLKGKNVVSSIIGIGLNVNQVSWPSDLPNPVSMKELTGIEYDPVEELKILRVHLMQSFERLFRGERQALIDDFDKLSFMK